MRLAPVILILATAIFSAHGKTWLRADGSTDTYTLVNRVLGGTAYEVPDCVHNTKHISQQVDGELNVPIFAFHIHVATDNDRCQVFDRQRVEIKTYDPSPNELKGFEGETVTLSWNFRLNSQFQASPNFCHVHQIKAVGGDDSAPIITFTPRNSNFQIQHTGRTGAVTTLAQEALSTIAGKWVHVREELTYGRNGKYSATITRLDNGQQLMSYSNGNIDLWRDGTSFVRPKWGIYRSLASADQLRDEHVYFNDFCLAKGTSDKCT